MLKKVSFPLTGTQISELIISKNYTSYFHLQEVLHEMDASNLLTTYTKNHMTYYKITDAGIQTIEYFENEISPEIREEISDYLAQHSYQMRSEAATSAEYYKEGDADYVVTCVAREGNQTLIELKLSVPTQTAAETLSENWKRKNQETYEAIMRILM
jgi:predicted transcriptional regulator